ncbi:histidine kinase [Croceicoccus estronivorus]|uniref:CHASE domain-containing protein n=1 Tax=Croceicoccus estronivorus TaxID=1172626 RepID=UPI000830B3E9|nr:CHASE domain-containing protein [Croceicoccus estronivorus]OCC25409.1 histidine kinase [Croceicoccus estronivorus]
MSKIKPARRGSRRWLVRYPRAVPLLIFLLTSAVTGVSVYAIERSEAQRERAQLHQTAQGIASALERRADANSAYLRAGAALLASQDTIGAEGFTRFVAELRLDSDYRGADGIGWAPRVSRNRIAAFEQSMAEEIPGGLQVHPALAPGQKYAVPVTFLHPDSVRNRRAIGFDMSSEPVRREAMLEAAKSARPVASGKLVLEQEGQDEEPGFLIYMPVYERGGGTPRLRGYIYSPFNAMNFLGAALRLESPGAFGIRLYDAEKKPGSVLAELPISAPGKMTVEKRLSIANHPWVLEVRASNPDTLSPLSLLTLIFGLLIASLLMVVARLLTQQAVEDQEALAWLEQQNSIRNSLTRELNHRVKNTLANVLSIVALTRRRSKDIDSFAEGLDGRIRALSATHDLLTQSDWGTTPIRLVIEVELAPYAKAGEHQLNLSGPDVELAPNDALSLGLAVHELATNAAKYGALSAPGGKVAVSWYRLSDTLARIEWIEAGGPKVLTGRTRGFGTDLIEKIVAHELGNPVDLRFEEHGVECSLTVPVREPAEFAMRARRKLGD